MQYPKMKYVVCWTAYIFAPHYKKVDKQVHLIFGTFFDSVKSTNMASSEVKDIFTNPVRRILRVIKLETNEISSVYFYAILSGLIQLSLPLGIQSIISFVLGGVCQRPS